MNKYYFFTVAVLLGLSLQGQSLVGLDLDNLSDAQILSIYEKGKAQGFTIENGEELAIRNGFSTDEALKFKIRLESLLNPEIIELEDETNQFNENVILTKSQDKNEIQEMDSSHIFGHDYFNIDLESFDKFSGAKAPGNYVLGPEDEITISIFGNSYFQNTFQVNEYGILNLGPQFGHVKIKGMRFKNVEKLLRARFARGFDLSKNTLDLNLSYGRKISVNIVGEVNNPGTYELSALNSAFHALVAAGGPTERGSLRNVSVYRAGDVIETIDFYQFFTKPEGFKNIYLQDGDFVMVSGVRNLVSISGAFKKAMSYETLQNESIQDLIDLSGGFSADAYDKKIQIFRNEDQKKIIIDVELKDFSITNLKDGDIVHANSKDGDLEEYVTVKGAFAQPGNYGYTIGMSLGDLISLAGGVKGRFPDKELVLSRLQKNGSYKLFRIPLDDKVSSFELQNSDYISLASREQDLDLQKVKIVGSVNNPGNYKYSKGMTLDDALKVSGGVLEKSDLSRIEITRRKIETNSLGVYEVAYESIIVSVDSSMFGSWDQDYNKSDLILNPYDIINVRTIKNYNIENPVHVSGQVEFPGYYPILRSDERITDVIKRAGGISEIGDAFNSQLFRQNENDSNFLFRLDMALSKNQYNYIIQPNDSIFIPKKFDIAYIKGDGQQRYENMGQIYLTVPLIPGQSAKKIINKYALGFSKKADKRNLSVSYPNGKYDRTKHILFFNIYPRVKHGGCINISKKEDKVKEKIDRKPLDWNQFVATVTSAAMGFGTIYALINRP